MSSRPYSCSYGLKMTWFPYFPTKSNDLFLAKVLNMKRNYTSHFPDHHDITPLLYKEITSLSSNKLSKHLPFCQEIIDYLDSQIDE